MTINTTTRSFKPIQTPRNFNTPPVSNINRQAVSLIGTGVAGVPFVPKFFNQFNGTSQLNALNSMIINTGDFTFNHQQQQGEILPYLTSYAILQNQGQLNYTRICGINLPDFPQLKPGFELDNDYSLYLMTLQLSTKNKSNNYYNFENHVTNQDYYQAIILAKNTALSIDELNNSNFVFNVSPLTPELTDNMVLGNIDNSSKFLQNKLFTFLNDDKPHKKTKFNFNFNDNNFFWKNSLNIDLKRIDTFGYAILNYSDVFNKINFEQFDTRDITVNLTLLNDNNLKKFNEPYHIAHTPWFVSQGFYTKEQNKDRLSNGLHLKDRVLKLFKIHSINPGKLSNNIIIKIIPTSLTDNQGYAQFHLHLIDRNSNDTFFEFNYLDLNPDSSDFIGRVIGNQNIYFDVNTKNVVVEGEYINQNPWIRVELSDAVINKNIPKDTIPAGFLGKNKIKSDLNDLDYTVLNNQFTVSPQFMELNYKYNSFELIPSHSWGVNLKNVEISNDIFIDSMITKINANSQFSKTTKVTNNIKMLKYTLNNLILKRNLDQIDYLNQNFYDLNDDNFDDMFHLEKILLFNQYIPKNNYYRQAWEYSKYIQSGDSVNNLKNEENNWKYIFDNNDDYENVMYYFTINQQAVTSNDINLDTVEEANNYSDRVDILSFQVDLSGGWEGLNLLDNDEYTINNKGLEKSQYLRELYKLALDINLEEVNGQNELIYLPEIYNSDIIDYACDLVYDKNHLLILDQPLYNINNEILYTRDFLELDKGDNDIQYGFSDQKYIFKNNNNNLNFNLDQTITNWSSNLKHQSNVISFGNYMHFKLLNGPDKPFNALGVEQDLILPAGFVAVNSLVRFDVENKKMNPIFNIDINSFGDISVVDTICVSFNHDDPNLENNLRKIRDLNLNVLQHERINGREQYRFHSDKTQLFDSYNNTILSKLNVRNTLNDIKKKVKLVSYPQIFRQILSKKEITDQFNSLYSFLLTDYVNKRLISNYKVVLDINTTSDEDIINGVVRGSIYIQFINQEIVQIPV